MRGCETMQFVHDVIALTFHPINGAQREHVAPLHYALPTVSVCSQHSILRRRRSVTSPQRKHTRRISHSTPLNVSHCSEMGICLINNNAWVVPGWFGFDFLLQPKIKSIVIRVYCRASPGRFWARSAQ